MRQNITLLSFTSLAVLASCGTDPVEKENTLVLHYDAPAQYFEESLPLGNGQLGALVYGGVGEEKISLNDITLWTGETDLVPWTPDAYKNLPRVRELLEKEDYAAAERENMKIEGHNSERYQPLGTLHLTDLKAIDQEPAQYYRELDIAHAKALTRYQWADGTRVERECFVSAPDSVIVLKLKSYNTSLQQRIGLDSQIPTVKVTATADGCLVAEGYAAYYIRPVNGVDQGYHYDDQRGIHFRTELRVQAPKGCVKADSDSTLLIEGCDEAVLVLTDVTSFNGPYCDPVREGRDYRTAVAQRLDAAMTKDYAQLKERHQQDYCALFNRVKLDLGSTPDSVRKLTTAQQLWDYSAPLYPTDAQADSAEQIFNPDLEELYFQYGRYLLISSSRTEGVPANLQGLWNESMTPPWSCNYTVNINVEENYWPAEIGALPEMHEAFLSWVERLPRSGAISAANYYGITAPTVSDATPWTVCHNSDPWCMTNPVGYQNESPEWCCWPLGAAWVCTHLWEHYMFTGDRAFLAKAYPVMQGAAEFYLQYLVEKDGHLITSPSTSPENHYITDKGYDGSTLYGGAADMAMIREFLTDVKHTAVVLGEPESEFLTRVDNTLERLLPYRIGQKGNLQEWYHDWEDKDPRHRHQSHLFGLYPGHHITVAETPDLAKACAKTLEIKGSKTTGWSAGWRVNLFARLRDGKGAYHMLRTLLSFVHPDKYRGEDRRKGGGTYPNLFDAHSPFQIDGNFGGTAGVMEMLVQSQWLSDTEASAQLLPALPAQWSREGSVSGIRLRGGWELSMSWRDGKVTQVNAKSLRTTPGKLHITAADGQTWEF